MGIAVENDQYLDPSSAADTTVTGNPTNRCRIGYRHNGQANILALAGNTASSRRIRPCKNIPNDTVSEW